MKRLFLLLLLLIAACGSATPEAIETAKKDAQEQRGFSVLSESSDGGDWFTDESVTLEVSFGEEGCTGTIKFQSGAARLTIELPIPGSPSETTYTNVDDPSVAKLRKNSAFKRCFAADGSQPTG